MTTQEFIDLDLPFFHVTPITNQESIISTGLSRKNSVLGICVVRSSDSRIFRMIAEQFLQTPNVSTTTFCVFRIIPSRFGITASMLARDEALCFTAPIHSYIYCDPISVGLDDIYTTFDTSENPIGNWETFESQLTAEKLIQELDYGNGSRLNVQDIFRSSDGKE